MIEQGHNLSASYQIITEKIARKNDQNLPHTELKEGKQGGSARFLAISMDQAAASFSPPQAREDRSLDGDLPS